MKYMFFIFLSPGYNPCDLDFPSQQRPQQLIADKYAGPWKAHLEELMAKALCCLLPFKNQLPH